MLSAAERSRIAEAVAPGAKVIRSSAFRGGLSSEMTLVAVELADGSPWQFVVRRAMGARGSIPLAREYGLLEVAWARGLPVPEPLLLDDTAVLSDCPAMVLAYIDGSPRCTDDDGIEKARRIADVLARIHHVEATAASIAALPDRTEKVLQTLATREPPFDAALVEREIVEMLRPAWPPRPPDRRVLLHCDIWLGNLLWSDRDIVGVIDWETAHVGDPLADLAITRLECVWSFGRDAVDALTERYATRAPVDTTVLAVWDLAAALRPVDHLGTWAGGWADYGRPDMTFDRMRAAHRWFVDDALATLSAAG